MEASRLEQARVIFFGTLFISLPDNDDFWKFSSKIWFFETVFESHISNSIVACMKKLDLDESFALSCKELTYDCELVGAICEI